MGAIPEPKRKPGHMKKLFLMAIAATLLLSLNVAAQNAGPEAKTAIDAAMAAMGTAGLQSIQYSGSGAFYATGQAYQPGGPWPRYPLKNYTMLVHYTAPSMRQELGRLEDENPTGGG